MNREQSLGAVERRIAHINRSQISGHKARHPVIQVNDVKALVECFGKLEHCTTKESETLRVVGFTVEFRAGEILGCIDEVNRHFTGVINVDGYSEVSEIERHRELAGQAVGYRFNFLKFVAWHHDPNLVTEPRHCLGKGARHIGQTPGLSVGHNLRRCQ